MEDNIFRLHTDNRPSWDETWMSLAETIGRRSKCSRANVGAVIVTFDNRIVATGYNGPPAEYPADGPCVEWCPRAMNGGSNLNPFYDDCPSVHAEMNAIAYADRQLMSHSTMYVSSATCMSCAKVIANSGVKKIVHAVHESDKHRAPDDVESFLRKCGIYTERADK